MKAPEQVTVSVKGALAVAGIWLAIAAVVIACVVWGPVALLALILLFMGGVMLLLCVGLSLSVYRSIADEERRRNRR